MADEALFPRRTVIVGVGAAVVAGVVASGLPQAATAAPLSRWERDGETYLGRATAPLVLLEYASFTCPHCAAFHREVLPSLKRTFIDTGRVRYVFRPMLTAPAELAGALQVTVDCAPTSARYAVIDALMREQNAIMASTQTGGTLGVVAGISQRAGGANEAQITACLSDRSRIEPILASGEEGGRLYGIQGTPGLVLNGTLIPSGMGGYTIETVSAAIVAAERTLRPAPRPAPPARPAPPPAQRRRRPS